MREYRSSLNNAFLIFSILFIAGFFGIWGEFTPILNQKLFPATNLQINVWIVLFSIPYVIFGTFLLLFSITKYFSVYIGNKAYNARKYTIFMGIVFLGFDLFYILIRQEIILTEFFDFSSLSDSLNVFIIVHMSIIVLFAIIGILTRNRAMSAYNIDHITSRMRDIDRRLNTAEQTSAAAQRIERRAQYAQEERRKQRERENQRRKEEERKRQQSLARRTRPPSTIKTSSSSRSSNKTQSDSRKPSSTKISSSGLSKKELLSMKPKTGILSKEDFMCIFCFELPSTSDRDGIVLCPNCRYPAHYHEFKEWIRNSKLCSRCDGVIPQSFIRNPEVIPVKTYLKAYKYFKKQF